MAKKKSTAQHGGPREGSGKPTFFRGRYANGGHVAPLRMSNEAYEILDGLRARLTEQLQKRAGYEKWTVSRNTYIEGLMLRFKQRSGSGALTLDDLFRLDR